MHFFLIAFLITKTVVFKLPLQICNITCITNVGLNTFQCTGIKCWNGLPSHIRTIQNNKTFKAKSKQHLVNEMFNEENKKKLVLTRLT